MKLLLGNISHRKSLVVRIGQISVLLVFLKECPEPEEVCGAPFTGGAEHPFIPAESLGYSASRKEGSREILESLPMPKQAPREQERVFG